MAYPNVEVLHREWQWLVRECASALHAARLKGASSTDLRVEERRYELRIDAAYSRLKLAETRAALR